MIQLFRPSLGDEELESVRKTFESGWIGLGPRTAEFENAFSKYVGVKHAVATNSATAALDLALKAFHITSGEVLLPSLTFVSTAHAALYNGAKPVFVDVKEDTLCMDVEDLKKKITSNTKAIIPVHYSGHPCDMDEIHEIADKKGIIVIEDAAQACGAEYRGKKIGGLSNATCFSFEAKKNLTTGEGGMITTDNKSVDAHARLLRWVGINKDAWQRSQKGYSWYYEVEELGYKYHMSDIQAAIGLVQLKKLEEMNARRRRIVELYNAGLRNLDWLRTPTERSYVKSAFWDYVIKVENGKRNELISYLGSNGIEAGVHYMPVHMHPFYKRLNLKVDVPVTNAIWTKLVTLPLHPNLSDEDVQIVINAVGAFR